MNFDKIVKIVIYSKCKKTTNSFRVRKNRTFSFLCIVRTEYIILTGFSPKFQLFRLDSPRTIRAKIR